MGPTRTKTRRQQDEGPVAGPSQPRKDGKKHKHRPKHTMQEASGTPGLQKLKASLRQTRRLLAKDNLAADVRTETERRLKALEADLAIAERSQKERTLAVRYHKVKFFERQKVVRKLNQLKKQMLEEDSDAEETLQSLRVDLNYILHYPKMKKYISLFPPELRSGETPQPSLDAGREEVRKWVREQMASGDLPAEPELHLDSRGGGAEWEAVSQPKKKKKQEAAAMELDEDQEQDEFFDDDDE